MLYVKEICLNQSLKVGFNPFVSGLIGGFCGGIAQTVVVAPCTFLVTAVVTNHDKSKSVLDLLKSNFKAGGIKSF